MNFQQTAYPIEAVSFGQKSPVMNMDIVSLEAENMTLL